VVFSAAVSVAGVDRSSPSACTVVFGSASLEPDRDDDAFLGEGLIGETIGDRQDICNKGWSKIYFRFYWQGRAAERSRKKNQVISVVFLNMNQGYKLTRV
jgi:hypothetical protein